MNVIANDIEDFMYKVEQLLYLHSTAARALRSEVHYHGKLSAQVEHGKANGKMNMGAALGKVPRNERKLVDCMEEYEAMYTKLQYKLCAVLRERDALVTRVDLFFSALQRRRLRARFLGAPRQTVGAGADTKQMGQHGARKNRHSKEPGVLSDLPVQTEMAGEGVEEGVGAGVESVVGESEVRMEVPGGGERWFEQRREIEIGIETCEKSGCVDDAFDTDDGASSRYNLMASQHQAKRKPSEHVAKSRAVGAGAGVGASGHFGELYPQVDSNF